MPTPEQPSPHHDARDQRRPFALPPDLAAFLAGQEVACLLQETDQGTAFVIKLPATEIASVRGTMPIGLRHELYQHPAAPVIRTVLTVYDQPQTPLALETYTNIHDPEQRAEFAALIAQDRLLLLFYDEALRHQLTKIVPNQEPQVVTSVLFHADRLLAAIPADQVDFDRAKRDVLEATEL